MKSDKKALTVRDIAVEAGVSTDTVYNWVAKRILPAFEFPGSEKQPIIRIKREDWDKFQQGARR
jgi:excisionase family DNA binding protein